MCLFPDPALPEEENVREFGITLPFGTKSPESFADAENYIVSNSAAHPLRNSSITCAQGLNNDETWQCSKFVTSHIVCGHFGVFTFVYPNYEISETATSIRMQVRRTGGGYGDVAINYYIKHFTTNDSDLVATAPYTTKQRLTFESGKLKSSATTKKILFLFFLSFLSLILETLSIYFIKNDQV